MARKNIYAPFDDNELNKINYMFIELYDEYIAAGDNARDARVKAEKAVADAIMANQTARDAKGVADLTRDEMLAIIREQTQNGDLAPEIAQARQGHETIGENFNSVKSQLAHTQYQTNVASDDAFYGGVTYNRNIRPAMVIIDDDGFPQVYQHLKPIAESEGVPISMAIIPHRVDNPTYLETGTTMTLEEIRECVAAGMEVVSHTMTHPRLSDLPENEIHYELSESKKWLHEHGFPTNILVYPFGSANPTVRSIASMYYRASFQIDGGHGQVSHPPLDQQRIRRVAYNYQDGTNDVERIKQKIDEAFDTNGLLAVMMHCHYDGFDPNGVREIVRYAKQKGVDIITAKEAIESFGNIIDTPSLQIAADGRTTGNLAFEERKDLTAEDPITAFPKNTVTRSGLSSANAVGSPSGVSGTLTTYRFEDNAYAYQIWVNSGTGYDFIRTWNVQSNSWNPWRDNRTSRSARNRTFDFGTIPARSTVRKSQSGPLIYEEDTFIIARVEGALNDGLVSDFHLDQSTRTAYYTIANITDSPIEAGNITFRELNLNI